MKKALYVATVDIHIKSFHLPYLEMLHNMDYEIHVATNGVEQFPYCDKKHTICIERNPFKPNNLKAIKQLKKIIRDEKIDLIHCHTPMGSVVARLAAKDERKKGTKVFYTCHGFHFYKGAPIINWLLFYPIEKYLSKYTDTLITINQEDYQLAKKKFNKRCKNIEYIPGVGINPEKFNFEMSEQEKLTLKKSLGLKKEDFVMIYPARLDKNKNQRFLIKCMQELVKEHTNIHLLLPGTDELNGYYQRIVNENKLNKHIHFLGFRDDIPKLMKISNIAVSSSLREGLPVNIIEAFMCGLPVVALSCRGMEDLITNNENGNIINFNKKNYNIYFINSILDIYNNKNKYKIIQENNKNKAYDFELTKIKERYKEVYLKKD